VPLPIPEALPRVDIPGYLGVFDSCEYIFFREPTAVDNRSPCPTKIKAARSETAESPRLVKFCGGNRLGRGGSRSIVLIVDDDGAFRKHLCTLFDSRGVFDACVEAQDGVEAIAKTKHLSPNLVVLDFSMPEMNGLELARELKAIEPHLAIFMLTANYDLDIEKEALSCGVTAVFSKLDDLATLIANAQAVCGIE
jgi:CheY-like chemotaxis protein